MKIESAMGVKLSKIDELDGYRHQINQIGKFQVERFTVPVYISDFGYKWFGPGRQEQKVIRQVHDFTGKIISIRRSMFQTEEKLKETSQNVDESYIYGKKRRFAMLDTLLMAEYNNKQIDAAGIQEEVDTFVFEGFDTTMTAITFILFMIAHHQDVQQQVFEEIDSRGSEYDPNDSKYLDAVIKESLRLYPPVPVIGRVLGEDTVISKTIFSINVSLFVSYR